MHQQPAGSFGSTRTSLSHRGHASTAREGSTTSFPELGDSGGRQHPLHSLRLRYATPRSTRSPDRCLRRQWALGILSPLQQALPGHSPSPQTSSSQTPSTAGRKGQFQPATGFACCFSVMAASARHRSPRDHPPRPQQHPLTGTSRPPGPFPSSRGARHRSRRSPAGRGTSRRGRARPAPVWRGLRAWTGPPARRR